MIRRLISTVVDITNESSIAANQGNFFNNFLLEKHLDWIFEYAPCFVVPGDSVQILTSPDSFYKLFLEKCKSAKNRITITSLYIGTGELEQKIISTIENNKNLKNGSLKVNILLDFARGSRGQINSRTLILPLLRYEPQVNLSLYHTPMLRGIYKRLLPEKVNELVGLQHMKIYIFDNTVILSGANLSNDYFTNRQDRYLLINDKKLTDFYDELVKSVQTFSLFVDKNNNLVQHSDCKQLPYKGSLHKFVNYASNQVLAVYNKHLKKNSNIDWNSAEHDTVIFPLIEMGQLGIHNDSHVTNKFLTNTLPGSIICFSTGYFNLTKTYINALVNHCQSTCKIIMAHPNANGFQGARGPLGSVPTAYTLLAKEFENQLKNKKDKFKLFEYERKGWTFHSKGLWYYSPGEDLPILTFGGSSNFGERSVKRDIETQVVVVTKNKKLQRQLHEECNSLLDYVRPANLNRPVPLWVYSTVHFFKNFF